MQPPDRLEHFDILRRDDGTAWELGRGAMGVTYKARDTRLHSDVALKVIHPLLNASKDVHDRFLREARAAAALRHPNIASAMHLGETPDGGWYYVMEFCEGPTLQEAVVAGGPFPPPKAVTMATQIARALVAAEAQGIVHRDLKPTNLIITERVGEGMVTKVIDFGLARALDADAAGGATLATQGTGFLGTVQFASPEQLEERTLDIRSDFYSLGACLWYALTGQPIFRGPLARVMAQTLSTEPDWTTLGEVAPAVLVLLKRLLAKDPDSRPRNGEALLTECRACLKAISNREVSASKATESPMPSAKASVRNSLYEGETLLERYQVKGVPSKHLLGTDAALLDLEQPDEPLLRGLFIDATVLAAPPVLKRLQTLITRLHEHPHAALPAIVTWAEFGADWLVVMEHAEGCKLLDVLKARSALPLKEALDWLLPVAEGMDHAFQHGLGLMEAGLGSITIHFEATVQEDLASCLQRPKAHWPRHRLIVDAFAWEQSADGPHTPSTMPTVATRQMVVKNNDGAPSPATPAAMIAALVMELTGGTPPQAGKYTPLPRLSEESNTQLRQAWLKGGAEIGAAKLIRQLKQGIALEDDLQGMEKAPKPLKAVSKSEKHKAPPSRPTVPQRAHSPGSNKFMARLPLALGACLIVVGSIFVMTIGNNGQDADMTTQAEEKTAPVPTADHKNRLPPLVPVTTPPPKTESSEVGANSTSATTAAVKSALKTVPEPPAKPGDELPPYARGIVSSDIDRSALVSASTSATAAPAAPVQERLVASSGSAPVVVPTSRESSSTLVPLSKRGREVSDFVTLLQDSENAQEIDVIMSYYAPVVDYYEKGRITSDEVRTHKLTYYERWPRSKATINDLRIRSLAGEEAFEARYTSDFLCYNPRGEWVRGQSIQTLVISFRDNLPQVIKESGESLGRVSGKPGETPPTTLSSRVPATKSPAGSVPKSNKPASGDSFRDAARRFDNL
jgi:hypothetical protein